MSKLSFEVLGVEVFDDFANLNQLGGCADYGNKKGLILKRFAFKWSPSRGAWVRMLNGSGIHAAKTVIAALAALEA